MKVTAPPSPAVRQLREICEAALAVNCGHCWALPGDECVFTTVPVSVPVTSGTPLQRARGYHVARFSRAFRRGLVTGPELISVLQALPSFTDGTVIYDVQAVGEGRDGSADDDDERCPRCAAVSWGSTPDGRLECTRCLWREPAVL